METCDHHVFTRYEICGVCVHGFRRSAVEIFFPPLSRHITYGIRKQKGQAIILPAPQFLAEGKKGTIRGLLPK